MLLIADGQPVVLERSLLPLENVRGAWHLFQGFGARPLGAALFSDPLYLESLRVSIVFAASVAVLGLTLSLTLAYFADRALRARLVFRTLLIWPYAVAPAVAGVLWMFMFSPSFGIVTYWLREGGVTWNHMIDGGRLCGGMN